MQKQTTCNSITCISELATGSKEGQLYYCLNVKKASAHIGYVDNPEVFLIEKKTQRFIRVYTRFETIIFFLINDIL